MTPDGYLPLDRQRHTPTDDPLGIEHVPLRKKPHVTEYVRRLVTKHRMLFPANTTAVRFATFVSSLIDVSRSFCYVKNKKKFKIFYLQFLFE